jgi:hypothetical protein
MASFTAGFNTVAGNIQLILLPVLLDLLLWFGPHLRLKSLFLPRVLESIAMVREMGGTDARLQMPEGIEQLWTSFLEHYNLLSTINTFPVGVPAMMAGQGPLKTPLGNAQIIEVNNLLAVLGVWLLATVVGLVLGSLYFASVARCSVLKTPGLEESSPVAFSAVTNLRGLAWQIMQVVLLVIVLFVVLMILFLPTLFITTILSLLSPTLSMVALLAMSFLALWLMIPLVFSPHGIFLLRQNALSAMLTSARLVRFFLPGTGLFLLISVIFYQGLGALWRTPPDTSWMALVGVLGHAFISTALLSASFIYYRSGHEFVLSLRKSVNSA